MSVCWIVLDATLGNSFVYTCDSDDTVRESCSGVRMSNAIAACWRRKADLDRKSPAA
jgi:hypothetical protein